MKRDKTTTQSMEATYQFTSYEGNPISDRPLELPFRKGNGAINLLNVNSNNFKLMRRPSFLSLWLICISGLP